MKCSSDWRCACLLHVAEAVTETTPLLLCCYPYFNLLTSSYWNMGGTWCHGRGPFTPETPPRSSDRAVAVSINVLMPAVLRARGWLRWLTCGVQWARSLLPQTPGSSGRGIRWTP